MKPDFQKIAASRISQAVKAPQVPKGPKPAKPPKSVAPTPRPLTPLPPKGQSFSDGKPGNRFGTLKPPGTKATPRPFQGNFTAGKSGKIPGGLAKAAENRLKLKKAKGASLRGVKWMKKAK